MKWNKGNEKPSKLFPPMSDAKEVLYQVELTAAGMV